jgi:hypothetical protein
MSVCFLIIPVIVVAALGFRIAAAFMDHARIENYIRSLGGKVITIRWSPFGPGWFGEKSDRIYRVRYVDRDGDEHEAYCKTSMWSGVYMTQDYVVGAGDRPLTKMELLELENQHLREELERLKKQQARPTDSQAIREDPDGFHRSREDY